ncbi:MAG: glutaredoxin 3, partial [Proteobacteria bacterium]|nr:glutaredoxin 3 [Pseudomonadota bacterium]
MARVEIYEADHCPYCWRAKALLQGKGVAFETINVTADHKKRDEMLSRTRGRYTVPQIFIDGEHVGGCDDLYALDRRGELDAKLGRAAQPSRDNEPNQE